jgi:hypothetical protein
MSECQVAAAQAEILDSEMLPEEENGEDLEDDNGFEVQSISFDEQGNGQLMQALDEQVNAATVQDETTRIYQIECNLIDDFANRSLRDSEKNALCKRQWAEWLTTPILDHRLREAMDLPPSLFWNAITTSPRWRVLGEYTSLVISPPTSETEDERTFSIRKSIIEERGTRSKNDLIVARIRAKMKYLTIKKET